MLFTLNAHIITIVFRVYSAKFSRWIFFADLLRTAKIYAREIFLPEMAWLTGILAPFL